MGTKRSRSRLPRFTDRLNLGRSGLSVSPFCLGYVRTPDAIPTAFGAGINFFFLSADLHWGRYEASRHGLEMLLASGPKIRRRIVVAVTIYPTQPEFCVMGLEEVLEAVPGLETIDVAVAGGAYGHEFLTRLSVFQAHRSHRFTGVRAIGATFHDRQAALLAVNHDLVDITFLRYNPSHPGARRDVFPYLKKRRATLLYNFTNTNGFVPLERFASLGLSEDHWQPRATDYHRFALSRPEFDGLLCSPSTPEEIAMLGAALEEGPLDSQEEQYLQDLVQLNEGRAKLLR